MGDAAARVTGRAQVVARDAERATIDEFLAALPLGARGLVIRGEPGIGKTVLWRYALEQGRQGGCHVLVTRPAEEELPMALVGLGDLLEDAGAEQAEGAALDPGADPSVRGRAVLDSLRGLAGQAPTLVAIDDVQWLDSVSARALRYGLRRLDSEPVGVVATLRAGAEDPLAAEIWPPGRHEAIELGPLSLGALRRVLEGTVSAISRPVLSRIHEVSGGNPLYAIELARGLSDGQHSLGPVGALPLPESLQAAIAGRLELVPEELWPLLSTASCLGPVSVLELREAMPGVDVDALLAVAERHELVLVEEDLEVHFWHPLIGSAVYARMGPLARRALHARLAVLTADPDVKARHAALSTDEPDAGVAAMLEEAAVRVSGRGAPDLAADFARHSVRLTPPEDAEAARRRFVVEIQNLAAAGEAGRALALADRLVESLPPGPGRADALVERFHLENDDLELGEELLLQAVEDAGEDELLRGRVLDMLTWLRGVSRGDVRGGLECAREAAGVADRLGDDRLLMLTESALAFVEALGGAPQPERMQLAVELEEADDGPPVSEGPKVLRATELLWSGELDAARASFDDALAEVVRWGIELKRPWRLRDLALVECAAGDFTAAGERVRQGIEAARDAEFAYGERLLQYPLALVAAWVGRAAEARATAEVLLESAEQRGELPGVIRARGVLGLLALSEGDVETAAGELADAVGLLEQTGIAHPGAIPVLPDAIDALAGCGDLAAAEGLTDRLERQAAAVESRWASTAAMRSRGVLLLSAGEPEAALPPLEGAAAGFDALGHKPDAARAVLAYGRALLRGGHRSRASDALEDARRRFAAMGAALWEARADEELERAAPGRSSGVLTHAERRIAALVARGLKNKEIARALFMSVATVEAHLTRTYRKLGIRSRSELARLVAEGSIPIGTDEGRRPQA